MKILPLHHLGRTVSLFRDLNFYLLVLIISITLACSKKNQEPVSPSIPSITNQGYDFNDTTLTSAGWKKEFSEDFDSNFSKWNIWVGGAFNNEYQYYTNASSNLSLSNGILIITAKNEAVTGVTDPWNSTSKNFNFTSARIESKTMYTSNDTMKKMRFAARIKLPSGYGMWPAFWSYGDSWPTNGEIDILEAKGNLPLQYATNYFYGTSLGVNLVTEPAKTVISSTSLVDYWHVYEVIWENSKLTFMLDGVIVDTKTGPYIPSMYDKMQRITLNLAVGGAYFNNPAVSSIQTGTLYVDWVKAFSSM